MSLLEVSAVERFAHALAEPLEPAADTLVAEVEARTVRMTKAVDEIMAKFAAKDGDSEKTRADHLKVVEGLIVMISSGIRAKAADIAIHEKRLDKHPDEVEAARPVMHAMYDAHDAMVDDYYRLMTLKANLDPDSKAEGPGLRTAEELKAWLDEVLPV